MPLGEFSIICVGFLRIFGEKSQKGKNQKDGHHGPLRRGLTAERPRAKKATPRVQRLRHDKDTVHHDQISDFCSESRVFVHR